MTLNLIRRLVKGSRLTAPEHDGNLDKLEAAIEAIEPTPGTDLSYDPATRQLSSSTGDDVTLPVATTLVAGLQSAADKVKLDGIVPDRATLVLVSVRNATASAIGKGVPVYVLGSSGVTISVAPADASVEGTAAGTLGLTQDAIAANSTGYVVAVGELTGVNTSTLTEGALIWLSETTGSLTTTRPTQPAHGVVLGYCVKQGAGTSGIIYVKVDNGQELDEIHDVLITGASTGQVLRRAADGLWKNATLTGGDVGLGNVNNTADADKPISTATATALAGKVDSTDARLTKLDGIAAGAEVNVNADWAAASGDAQILNKPTLGSAAALNVGTTAGTVAAGNDPRFAGVGSAPTFTGYSVGATLVPFSGAVAAGTSNLANQINLIPFYVERAVTIDQLSARVTTAIAGSSFQLAFYNHANGVPTGNAFGVTGSMSGVVADIVTASITPTTFQPMVTYWLASNTDSTITFTALAAGSLHTLSIVGAPSASDALSGGTVFFNYAVSETFGNWPNLTGASFIARNASSRRIPVVAMRVSALP